MGERKPNVTGPGVAVETQNRAVDLVILQASVIDAGHGYISLAAARYRLICHKPAPSHNNLTAIPMMKIQASTLSKDAAVPAGGGLVAGIVEADAEAPDCASP
jgi:hypothetical protein